MEDTIRERNLQLKSSERRDTAFAKRSYHKRTNTMCTRRDQSIGRDRIANIDVMDMVAPYQEY